MDNTIIIVYRCATTEVCFTLLLTYLYINIFLLVHCRFIMLINCTREGKIIWHYQHWKTHLKKKKKKEKRRRKNSLTNLHNGKGNSYSSTVNSFKEIRTLLVCLFTFRLSFIHTEGIQFKKFSSFPFLFRHIDKYVNKQDSWETVKMIKYEEIMSL